jgi:hypothetical protein
MVGTQPDESHYYVLRCLVAVSVLLRRPPRDRHEIGIENKLKIAELLFFSRKMIKSLKEKQISG